MKKILITGSAGFVGKNLAASLAAKKKYELLLVDIDTPRENFLSYLDSADFVAHLAGVNRPENEGEFFTGNAGLTEKIAERLSSRASPPPLLITSSIQSDLDNPYGKSKRMAEETVFAYGAKTGAGVYVYKLPNLFGKWSRPNYNSVVATFCHNTARGLPIEISDPERVMTLCYIDDVIAAIEDDVGGAPAPENGAYCEIENTYDIKLGELAEIIGGFKDGRESLFAARQEGLRKALYAAYLSYLEPKEDFAYGLAVHSDARGGFYEFFKTDGFGQFSVSTTKPGITRGNHWHHTKTEKFLVVGGRALVRFRKIGETEIFEYEADSKNPRIIDIPPGYTHSIVNISDAEILTTVIWASETFEPDNPDTYFEEV